MKESEFINAIENYMFEEHSMIRRAAVQCWTNLCCSPLMMKRCEGKNDKVKYAVLLCGDDDDAEICKAAAGGLAMLTSQSTKLCKKIFEVGVGDSSEKHDFNLFSIHRVLNGLNVF